MDTDLPPMLETEEDRKRLDHALRTLIRGATQRNMKEVYAGHKAPYEIGRPAVLEAIERGDWTRLRYPNQTRYFAGLASILHDLDEDESKRLANRLKQGRSHPAIVSTIESICAFTIADYHEYELMGIKIFQHHSIPASEPVGSKLKRWLRVAPTEDLVGIERIYVLPAGDHRYLGCYTPFFCNVSIVWNSPYSRWNPLRWMPMFMIERTLYHEIGHHWHRHRGAENPVQEEQADRYSQYLLASSSHLIFRLIRGVVGPPKRPKRED
jgi:hypothetical protein